MDVYNKDCYAVIMAGGIGSRLWPSSTAKHPKQFQDVLGVGESLLQSTFKRLAHHIPFENIWVLTNKDYLDIVVEQLPKIEKEQVILEPTMRNTAPCILLAAMKIRMVNPDAVMIVAPSDHFIKDENAFTNDLDKAFDLAKQDEKLITLGIKPLTPHTGYGYIRYEDEGDENHKKVLKFTEKPTRRNAKKFLEEGNYLWNAGIFIWRAKSILKAFEKYQLEMFQLFKKGKDVYNQPSEKEFIDEVFPKAQNISIDYAILEKAENVWVIPASFEWSDLGTWNAVYNELGKDEYNNVAVSAKLMPTEAENNLVYSHQNKLVVIEGLKDYIIINEKDVLLIIPREKEQEIKQIRAKVIDEVDENLG